MKYLLVVLTSFLLLSGCQGVLTKQAGALDSGTKYSTYPDVYLTHTVEWSLPSAAIVDGDFTALQSVTGRYGTQTFELLFQLEKKGDSLVMVGIAPMGQQLLQIEYKGGVLTSKISPLLGEGVRPVYLVSDFLLAFGNAEQLALQLGERKMMLSYTPDSRTILSEGKPVLSIHFSGRVSEMDGWPKETIYRHDALGYTLDITTLSREKL